MSDHQRCAVHHQRRLPATPRRNAPSPARMPGLPRRGTPGRHARLLRPRAPLHPRRARHPGDSVRAFVDARVLPTIADHWERGTFPTELIPEIAALGLLGCNLQGYGCAGLSRGRLRPRDAGARARRLGHPLLRQRAGVARHVSDPRLRLRRAEASATCPRWRKGEIIGCFGLTEPDFGSNPERHAHGGASTTATPTSSTARSAGSPTATSRTSRSSGPSSAAPDGEVRGFLVPTDTQRLRGAPHPQEGEPPRERHERARFSRTCASRRTPILPGVRGMKGPLSCLTAARFGIAWGVIGAATACFDCAVDYAKQRVQFAGKPIASHQLVQAKLAEMLTQITNMQLQASRPRASRPRGSCGRST